MHPVIVIVLSQSNRPKLMSLTDRLKEPVELCDVTRDMEVGSSCDVTCGVLMWVLQNVNKYDADSEGDMGVQMLPHFYAEDLVNVMNKERRREALAKVVGIVKADIERERRGR